VQREHKRILLEKIAKGTFFYVSITGEDLKWD
jgi:hypothetical protein